MFVQGNSTQAFLIYWNTSSNLMGYLTSNPIGDNAWHFLTGTHDVTTGVLTYKVDGVTVISGTITPAALGTATTPLRAMGVPAGTNNLRGSIGGFWHWNRVASDDEFQELRENPLCLLPRRRLRAAATSSVSVSLTGIALTASRGSVTAGLTGLPSGSAATSAAGTLTSALGSSLSGSAGTGAIGTVRPGVGVSVSGSAMTVSAGTLAYTIGFTLTGASSASAGGTISSSGGDTESERALTGISMSALPGNVRVTGGTRWVPQEARAATVATSAGNTMPPPPRLTGDVQTDIRAQQQYLQTFYDQFVKVNNVLGRINDHETRIAALEGDT